MYHGFTDEDLRSICRTSIESLEMWARRLIHYKMIEKYGENYIDYKVSENEYLIKKDIRTHVQRMLSAQSERFPRPVDTLFLDYIIYFLCTPKFYSALFKEALDYSYPQGRDEAKEFLDRLIPIRNLLSHSNSISIHQAERAICYSHDFVEGLKKYYKDKGLEQVWNVPRIIRITDSLGNVFENPDESHGMHSIFVIPQKLYCGETYSVSVEVDVSFSQLEYDIIWKNSSIRLPEFDNSRHYSKTLAEQNVGELFIIRCEILSHKKWHRHQYYDCRVDLHLQVLPPIV